MHAAVPSQSSRGAPFRLGFASRAALLLLPTGVLLLAAAQTTDSTRLVFLLGTGFEILLFLLLLFSRQVWHHQLGPPVITLYLVGLGWLWLNTGSLHGWFPHFAQAVLLTVPLVVFAMQTLMDSGALAARHAIRLAKSLADRRDWPTDLSGWRTLPEVKALREALHEDATPALALLHHSRPEVQVAALAALEFRKKWLPGQAEVVLNLAQRADQPAVRAAAITALGNVDDRMLVETLAEFLRDPAWEVRRAATEALLWDAETRWSWIRNAVRRALGDPALLDDGALRFEGQLLKPDAVTDLIAWSTEKGPLAVRSALTLGVHFSRALSERPDPLVIKDLKERLANPHAPATLRMELAQLLRTHRQLERPVVESLLDRVNPAPLRLFAAEIMLREERDATALATLRDVARLPNREIALSAADVVQRRLGIDLGLAMDEPLPALHSRQAAEVTRRVMTWAAQQEEQPVGNGQ